MTTSLRGSFSDLFTVPTVDRCGIRDVIMSHLVMSQSLIEFLEIVFPRNYHGMTESGL